MASFVSRPFGFGQQHRVGSPHRILLSDVESSAAEDTAPIVDETAQEEVDVPVLEEDSTAELLEGDEESKRIVARERHTAFVGNLPFGTRRILLGSSHG